MSGKIREGDGNRSNKFEVVGRNKLSGDIIPLVVKKVVTLGCHP